MVKNDMNVDYKKLLIDRKFVRLLGAMWEDICVMNETSVETSL